MNRYVWIALIILGLLAPFVVYPVFMMKLLCLALFACAFNLLLGYTGLLSFGHAAFLGASAYFTGYLVRSAGFSPELGVLAGTLGAGLIGLVCGYLIAAALLPDVIASLRTQQATLKNPPLCIDQLLALFERYLLVETVA